MASFSPSAGVDASRIHPLVIVGACEPQARAAPGCARRFYPTNTSTRGRAKTSQRPPNTRAFRILARVHGKARFTRTHALPQHSNPDPPDYLTNLFVRHGPPFSATMGHDEQVEEMEVLDSIFPEELTSKSL